MSHWLSRVLDRRPVIVMVLLLTITAVAGGLATQLKFEFSPQALLVGNDRLIVNLEEMKRTFAIEDSVLLVVIEATGDRDVVSPEILNWQAEAVKNLETRDGVTSVRSIATMEIPVKTLSFIPQLTIQPIVEEFPADEDDSAFARRKLERIPALTGTMLSRDLKMGLMLVSLSPDFDEVEQLTPVVNGISERLKQIPPPPGFRVSLSGLPYIRADAIAALEKDQEHLLPLSGVLYLLALILVFRRIAGSLLPLLAVGISLVWLMGIMVAFGSSFNLVSNVLPILLMVVGMSNCVHLLDAYAEELHVIKGDRREAARLTMHYMSRCCLVTLLTTGIGFLCLLSARSIILRQFAWQAAVGIGCLYVSIMGTFGATLRLFRPSRRTASGAPLGHVTTALARWVVRHPKLILSVSAMLVLLAVGLGATVHVNSSIIETYDDDHPTQVTMHAVERQLTGLLPIEVHLTGNDEQRLLSSEVARSVKQFEKLALTHAEVLYARSYIDVLRDLTGLSEEEWETKGRERTIDRGLSNARRIGSLSGLSDFLTENHRDARILLKVSDAGTLRLQEVIADLERDLQQRFPENSGISFQLTGDAYVNAMAMSSVIHDLFYSLLTASLVIFGLIAAIFRSVRVGMIASFPNLTPLALTLGYMGLRGYDMNVGNVIVFTISLGIAVDDSIHFLFRFREEMKLTSDVNEAVRRSFAGTGRAILVTSILIVTGLSVLMLSDFVPTRRFSELTSITMIGALIGDLFLLPACLVLFWNKKAAISGFGTSEGDPLIPLPPLEDSESTGDQQLNPDGSRDEVDT